LLSLTMLQQTGRQKKFRKKYKADNVHIIGYRPADEVPVWLKAADLLVLPNRGQYKISSRYTSPLKLFEYMASGTPIVAAGLSSIREIVSEGEALFFRDGDVASLAEVLSKTFSGQIDLKSRAEKAKIKAGEFTWNKRAQIILNSIKP
ncbi:MAG: glycosyltransferase, partial [Patescibacteria group bacterium]